MKSTTSISENFSRSGNDNAILHIFAKIFRTCANSVRTSNNIPGQLICMQECEGSNCETSTSPGYYSAYQNPNLKKKKKLALYTLKLFNGQKTLCALPSLRNIAYA